MPHGPDGLRRVLNPWDIQHYHCFSAKHPLSTRTITDSPYCERASIQVIFVSRSVCYTSCRTPSPAVRLRGLWLRLHGLLYNSYHDRIEETSAVTVTIMPVTRTPHLRQEASSSSAQLSTLLSRFASPLGWNHCLNPP